MDKRTFGSVEQYKMLEFLTEKISLMEDKYKNYLSTVIQDINIVIKKSNLIEDSDFKNYILDLINNDFSNRINNNVIHKIKENNYK